MDAAWATNGYLWDPGVRYEEHLQVLARLLRVPSPPGSGRSFRAGGSSGVDVTSTHARKWLVRHDLFDSYADLVSRGLVHAG